LELDKLSLNMSELGSAVATVHFNAGSDKQAKKLFLKSLVNPNENAVAQAEWAARRLGIAIPELALSVPFSFEANSAHSYRELDVDKSIEQAIFWKDDEPFASRPVGWLAHLHAINDDFEQAAEYHQLVLDLESEHRTGDLLNQNFSRIETGALRQASAQLVQLSRAKDADKHRPQVLANAGALAYASGEFELGRDWYLKAAAAAKSAGEFRTEALVQAFFARAATKYGDPHAQKVIDDVSKLPGISGNPSAAHVVRRLVSDQIRKALEASVEREMPKQKLTWDSLSNILTIR